MLTQLLFAFKPFRRNRLWRLLQLAILHSLLCVHMSFHHAIHRSHESISNWAIHAGNSKLLMKNDNTLGAYIHIPFCRRRCYYCNFPIKVVGEREETIRSDTSRYIDILLREIQSTHEYLGGKNELNRLPIETLYFGGGTPSLLSIDSVERIIQALDSSFGIDSNAEITFEADPGTFDFSYLKQLTSIGVNRLSMGVQSFNNEALRKAGRAHDMSDFSKAIDAVRQSDISNFNIDLISSLPGVSETQWRETLQAAVQVAPTHISVYDLQVEEKTAFGRWYTPGEFPLPSEEQAAAMYRTAVDELTGAGYRHYEVSNYAKSGSESQHNKRYWNCLPVLGFGMAAASLVQGTRVTRPADMSGYVDWVGKLESYTNMHRNVRVAADLVSSIEEMDSEDEETGGLWLPPGTMKRAPKDQLSFDYSQIETLTNESIDVIQFSSTNLSTPLENEPSMTMSTDEIATQAIEHPLGSGNGSPVDILEIVMLALRTADGLTLDSLGDDITARKIIRELQPYIERESVIIEDVLNREPESDTVSHGDEQEDSGGQISNANAAGKRLRLADPEGFLISNDIISSVFAVLS